MLKAKIVSREVKLPAKIWKIGRNVCIRANVARYNKNVSFRALLFDAIYEG